MRVVQLSPVTCHTPYHVTINDYKNPKSESYA